MIVNLLSVSVQQIVDETKKAVSELIATLQKPLEKWKILVPIDNFDIKFDNLVVANVTFQKFGEKRFLTEFEDSKKVLEQSKSPKNVQDVIIEKFRSTIYERFCNKIAAEVFVDAADEDRANEVALERVRVALDILTFYACTLLPGAFLQRRPYFGISGTVFAPQAAPQRARQG